MATMMAARMRNAFTDFPPYVRCAATRTTSVHAFAGGSSLGLSTTGSMRSIYILFETDAPWLCVLQQRLAALAHERNESPRRGRQVGILSMDHLQHPPHRRFLDRH